MADPKKAVEADLAQLATDVRDPQASPADLTGAAQASAGLGVTEADVSAIFEQIKALQDRLDQAEAQRRAAAPPDLVNTVQSLKAFVDGHADPAAVKLAEDALEAAQNATQSGDTSALAKIGARLQKQLAKNAPTPGENYFYRQALDWASNHLPEAIEAFVPVAKAVAIDTARAAVKVVEGSVVG